MGLVEIAGAILSRATQSVEVSAQNVANATTPGYKARRQFAELLASDGSSPFSIGATSTAHIDFSSGQLQNTGNNLDLALSGPGFFVVRSENETFYTRNGQFSRDADGKLVTADGMTLQSLSGDLVVPSANAKILSDGTVLDGDEPVGRIAVVNFADMTAVHPAGAGVFTASNDAAQPANPQVRQGMLEASNVSTADEMIATMAALRGAQSGQHVVQVYDDLMGRALTAFGQS
jgi:flagellar basal-body rod protein FlgF